MAAPMTASGTTSALQVEVRAQLAGGFLLDLNISVEPGIVVLFGSSGAGKTTTLNCIAGLTTPDAGRIVRNGRVLFDSAQGINVPVQKRRIGYLFQHLALFPHLTISENIQYGIKDLPRSERDQRTDSILHAFGVHHLRDRRPPAISGGERQRVALARALVTEPDVLLLDEPMAALDTRTRALILNDLRNWSAARPLPILYVTHSRGEVFAAAQRVLVMRAGKIVADGTPQEILQEPRHEWTALAAGFDNVFDIEVQAVHLAEGTMVCRIAGTEITLEVPPARVAANEHLTVGVRAGDVLLFREQPRDVLSRNVLRGRVMRVTHRDGTVTVSVDCGVRVDAHVTAAAARELNLTAGKELWLVINQHSCHLFRRA